MAGQRCIRLPIMAMRRLSNVFWMKAQMLHCLLILESFSFQVRNRCFWEVSSRGQVGMYLPLHVFGLSLARYPKQDACFFRVSPKPRDYHTALKLVGPTIWAVLRVSVFSRHQSQTQAGCQARLHEANFKAQVPARGANRMPGVLDRPCSYFM